MKRLLLISFLALFACFTVQAQNTAKAKEILTKMSSKYRGYSTMKADFKYILEIQADKFKEEQTGTLALKKDMFRLEMSDQTVISDTKNLWIYLKDVNEVQVNKYDRNLMDLNPSELFTMYENGFMYAYMGEETANGKTLQLIELTPTDKQQSYFKVKLYIDKGTTTIYRSKIYEKNGNIYTYEITNFKPNVTLADNYFTFDQTKYPKVSVVDLR